MDRRGLKRKYNKRLKEISKELFDMANDCAGDKVCNMAVFLHEAVNNLTLAKQCLDGDYVKVPAWLTARSAGLDIDGLLLNIAHLFNGHMGLAEEDKIDEN